MIWIMSQTIKLVSLLIYFNKLMFKLFLIASLEDTIEDMNLFSKLIYVIDYYLISNYLKIDDNPHSPVYNFYRITWFLMSICILMLPIAAIWMLPCAAIWMLPCSAIWFLMLPNAAIWVFMLSSAAFWIFMLSSAAIWVLMLPNVGIHIQVWDHPPVSIKIIWLIVDIKWKKSQFQWCLSYIKPTYMYWLLERIQKKNFIWKKYSATNN